MCVQLSGDGGLTWTTPRAQAYPSAGTLTTLTFGGSGDLWGATWLPGQLSNANFRLRLINVDDSATRTFDLDSVRVRVTYR